MKKVAIILSTFIWLGISTSFEMHDDLDDIAQKLQQYFNTFPAEKLYLHFSEDVWVAGGSVWCKAYLVKGKDLQPATDSKVIYAELRNRQGAIVQSLSLPASQGIAKGNFILSDSLSTGWYQIHAYTQWMLNFEEESHFIRPVFIANPFQEKSQGLSSKNITTHEDTVHYPLPEVIHSPVFMEIEQSVSDALQVKVRSRDTHYPARNLYLVAVSGENIVHAESLKLHAGEAHVELPYTLFHQRRAHIALFDEEKAVLDAQEVVIPYTPGWNLKITTDQDSYAPREKGYITLTLSDKQGNPLPAHASVTVRKTSALSDAMPDIPINSFLLSNSESTGFSQPIPVFDWAAIVHNPLSPIHFPKETEGITVKGKLLNQDGQPIAQQRVVLSVAGPEAWFQYDYTQEDGTFHLLIERVFGEKKVVIQAPEVDEPYQIVLEEEENQRQLPALKFLPNLDEQILKDFIQQCRQRVKIGDMYAFYQQDTTENPQKKKRQQAPFRFYGVPNVELYLEDYIALPNMEEVCRELLPGVQLKIAEHDYDFNVFDVRTRTFLPDEPSLFMDGVLVFDKAQIVNFPPENIEKIETVNRRTFYGDFPFNGVISIFTLAGNQYERMLPLEALHTTLSFYDKPESFLVVNEQEENDRTPDLRTLLYWSPDVKFDEEGKVILEYAHSDETGVFEIVVEGITPDGQLFSGETRYEVVFQ